MTNRERPPRRTCRTCRTCPTCRTFYGWVRIGTEQTMVSGKPELPQAPTRAPVTKLPQTSAAHTRSVRAGRLNRSSNTTIRAALKRGAAKRRALECAERKASAKSTNAPAVGGKGEAAQMPPREILWNNERAGGERGFPRAGEAARGQKAECTRALRPRVKLAPQLCGGG